MRLAPSLLRAAALVAFTALPALAQAREPIGRSTPTLTPAIRVGNLVFASGALPDTRTAGADTTIQGQTASALTNIKASLEAAGTTIDNAVKCTVFLVDGADFRGMNEAYAKFWPSAPPARTTVVVKALVVPNAKLEIECMAAMPAK
ncbi:MAG: RidA family protein [Gemmatimonadaceae bacterium]|nr:RidA family protein [Gemmatimonadaceae bacterium]